ncbi:MAG: hypothetical protein ACJAUP_000808 [Cellvibrionaceae bacterium]|jgi:hypothetical protein
MCGLNDLRVIRFHSLTLKKREKGIVIRFFHKISYFSRQQLTRLISQDTKTGRCVRGRPAGIEFIRM